MYVWNLWWKKKIGKKKVKNIRFIVEYIKWYLIPWYLSDINYVLREIIVHWLTPYNKERILYNEDKNFHLTFLFKFFQIHQR